jgi:hypothetical protein
VIQSGHTQTRSSRRTDFIWPDRQVRGFTFYPSLYLSFMAVEVLPRQSIHGSALKPHEHRRPAGGRAARA